MLQAGEVSSISWSVVKDLHQSGFSWLEARRTLHLVVVMANELPLTEEKLELVGSRTGAPLPVRSPFREPYSPRAAPRESAPEFHGKMRERGEIL